MNRIVYAKLHPDVKDPIRKHPSDAGIDVFAYHEAVIPPSGSGIVPTGLTFRIPAGFMLDARPKSRHDHLIGAGVIDTGYQGEILIKIVNYAKKPLTISKGDAIAQLVLVKIETPVLEEMPLEEIHAVTSDRGASGGLLSQFKQDKPM